MGKSGGSLQSEEERDERGGCERSRDERRGEETSKNRRQREAWQIEPQAARGLSASTLSGGKELVQLLRTFRHSHRRPPTTALGSRRLADQKGSPRIAVNEAFMALAWSFRVSEDAIYLPHLPTRRRRLVVDESTVPGRDESARTSPPFAVLLTAKPGNLLRWGWVGRYSREQDSSTHLFMGFSHHRRSSRSMVALGMQ